VEEGGRRGRGRREGRAGFGEWGCAGCTQAVAVLRTANKNKASTVVLSTAQCTAYCVNGCFLSFYTVYLDLVDWLLHVTVPTVISG